MTIQDFINNIITETAEEPMTLFISYAHREALICRLIVYSLKARGHKVWFDELNIPHGSDWRTEILRGIEDSGGVLSMISQDAVKPGGVCLDELSIAVGVRGGNIRTVLLEKNVTPPPTIMYRQWLDLTEWKNFRREDEELLSDPVFSEWFKEKITLLTEMLETRENREFEGQITIIKNALPLLYMSTSRQMFLLKELHIERTWLQEKTESWLDDPDGESICVIYGDPGIGKSAFAAHYAHYNGRVAAAIFCEKGQNTLNSPEAVIQTLAYMLACRIPDYRQYLADLLGSRKTGAFQNSESQGAHKNIGSLNADEMFEVLLATPLSHLIDGERPVECILVDGLDEAGNIDNNQLASVLQKYSSKLPKWLRVLVLSRSVEAVQKWLGGARHMNLTTEAQENRKDLEKFVREGLREYNADPGSKEKAIASIVFRSDGVFLYAKIALDALKEGKASLGEADSFPHGLDQIFLRWFQWYFPDIAVYNEKIRPALNLMTASPEPIPEEEIIAVTQWRRQQFGEFKRLMQVHLRESTNENGVMTMDFSHLFIREWLESPAASEYRIYADDGVLELGEYFDEILEDDEPEFNEYEALYIPVIMERAAGLSRSMRRAYKAAMRSEALMNQQEELGNYCWEWNRFYSAQQYLQNALQIAENRVKDEDIAENRKHIVICKNRFARIEHSLGHVETEKRLNEEALEIARQNLADRGLPEDLRRAAVSIIMFADCLTGTENIMDYYREAEELLKQAADRVNDEKISRNLAIVYNRIGTVALQRKDYATATESYIEDLKLSQRLAMETGKDEARRDFAVSCYKLANIYRICGEEQSARYYYNMALQTMEYLVKSRGQPEDIRGLIVLLNSRGQYIETVPAAGENAEAIPCEPLRSYERALAMSREMTSKYGLVRDHLYMATALTNIGIVFINRGDPDGAKGKWKEAFVIFAKYGAKETEMLNRWIKECEV